MIPYMGVCTQILCITDHFSTLHLTSVVNTHNLKKYISRDVLFLLTQLVYILLSIQLMGHLSSIVVHVWFPLLSKVWNRYQWLANVIWIFEFGFSWQWYYEVIWFENIFLYCYFFSFDIILSSLTRLNTVCTEEPFAKLLTFVPLAHPNASILSNNYIIIRVQLFEFYAMSVTHPGLLLLSDWSEMGIRWVWLCYVFEGPTFHQSLQGWHSKPELDSVRLCCRVTDKQLSSSCFDMFC